MLKITNWEFNPKNNGEETETTTSEPKPELEVSLKIFKFGSFAYSICLTKWPNYDNENKWLILALRNDL